jgi:hypothetical protein
VTIYNQRRHAVIVHRANIMSAKAMSVLVQKMVTHDMNFSFLLGMLLYGDSNFSSGALISIVE